MTESLKIAIDGSLFLSANCELVGTDWRRIDTTKTAEMLMIDINGTLKRFRASAGNNPITSWDLLNGVVVSDISGCLPNITQITTRDHNDLQNKDALLCHPPEAAGVLSQKSDSVLKPTKQTTSAFDKKYSQLQVVGSTIYYIWSEDDGTYYQIWTATSNLDGSGFTAAKRTTSAFGKYIPQLQVVGSTIYYVWIEHDGAKYQIWTATSNLDGSGFTAAKRTTSAFDKYIPQLQAAGSTIYYVWQEYDGAKYQIWTATSNLDGSGFTAAKRTTSAF
ncbi:MAG: hypothetical protein Q8J68_08100, partial [Methanolobus sp.]|uniref:hypothetical protein n=1 Tax=Methanolobus sp. TaxID=1874737 RepID=UPI00272F8E7F